MLKQPETRKNIMIQVLCKMSKMSSETGVYNSGKVCLFLENLGGV